MFRSDNFGQRGRYAKAAAYRTPTSHQSTRSYRKPVGTPRLEASYTLAFSWVGLLGFWLAIENYLDLPSWAPPSTFITAVNWVAIVVGIAVGCFSLWHALKGSPALIVDDAGVTGYNIYGRSHVAWDDIAFLTYQDSKNYGRSLEIRSRKKWLGVIPRGVCYSPKLADKTADEVIEAMLRWRPDLR